MPSFSVIIPCYNYAQYLKWSVRSVLCQSDKDFELIIVDDGSTDNSLELAQQIKNTYNHFDIKVLHQSNSGEPAATRNLGIQNAQGDFILCLDADDSLAPDMLKECRTVLQKNVQCELIYTDAVFFTEQDSWYQNSGKFDLSLLARENQLLTASLFSKRAWEKVGGYKLGIRGYEDWELWLSFAKLGVNAQKIEKPLFLYRAKEGGVWDQAKQKDQELRAKIILFHPELYDQNTLETARSVLSSKNGHQETKILEVSHQEDWLKRGLEAFELRDFQRAEECFEHLKAELIDNPIALNHLAIAKFALGKHLESRKLLEELLKRDPQNQTAKENFAALFS